jgi:hypothetical protein
VDDIDFILISQATTLQIDSEFTLESLHPSFELFLQVLVQAEFLARTVEFWMFLQMTFV